MSLFCHSLGDFLNRRGRYPLSFQMTYILYVATEDITVCHRYLCESSRDHRGLLTFGCLNIKGPFLTNFHLNLCQITNGST